jgi:hypothetical protein
VCDLRIIVCWGRSGKENGTIYFEVPNRPSSKASGYWTWKIMNPKLLNLKWACKEGTSILESVGVSLHQQRNVYDV